LAHHCVQASQNPNIRDSSLIALDLPDMSGIKVLRKAGDISDTKIILLAELGSMETAIAAIKHQAHDYILKPFEPQKYFPA